MANAPRFVPAHKRSHEVVVDLETGEHITLYEYMAGDTYGKLIEDKRVGLEFSLLDGSLRYVCPWCETAMVLRSRRVKAKNEDRFFFDHKFNDGSCTGSKGKSKAEICALKFGHTKEGAQHKQIKQWVLESLDADPTFTGTLSERRWLSRHGARWRQPDVQTTREGERIALEVQLATTFLHVIVERMAFYRGESGRLLWLFGDIDPAMFRLAEDDIFYSNNRNAFRVGADTLEKSREHGRFALECSWHVPHLVAGHIVDKVERDIVFFDQLVFDINSSGAPRTYYFDYDKANSELEQVKQAKARSDNDQALRDDVEEFVRGYSKIENSEQTWLQIRQRLVWRGFELPTRFYGHGGPFYHFQAAYSAKIGRPVMCNHPNLRALGNTLHQRHIGTLWVFLVMSAHFGRGEEFRDKKNGSWQGKVDAYWLDCAARSEAARPDRNYDALLAFLFPSAASLLRASPASASTRMQVQAALSSP